MARKYAVDHVPGIKGTPVTHVGGQIVPPGDALPAGTREFDLTYWYFPTPVDIAAGATPGERVQVFIPGVSVNDSLGDIRNAILDARKQARLQHTWGT